MSQGTEHQLEQAEHVQHHAHDPFDRKVAMTMAIVAAVLAFVTMLSHREHNETLRFQTKVNIHHTTASDQWSFFQAKKSRQYSYEAFAEMLALMAKDSTNPKAAQKTSELNTKWHAQAATYKQEAEEIQAKAKAEEDEAAKNQEKSNEAHHRGNFFDLGELGVELALVLCSLAVLARQRGFWYSGIGFGILGTLVALSGFLFH